MLFLSYLKNRIAFREIIATFILFFSPSILFADDIIILHNGDILNGIVTEISSKEIKYKKASNPNGPIYTIDKDSVLSIKYPNGEIDKFETKTTQQQDHKEFVPIQALAAENNEEHKSKYAQLPKLNLKPSNKKAKEFFPMMAFTDSSIISTKELTIIIEPQAVMFYDGGWRVKIGYTIVIVNKTNQPIYIDRANCFRRFNDLSTKSYFNNQQTIVSHGNSTGFGIGSPLVGIGVGSSSSSTYSENYNTERFLTIGPKSKANLVDYQYVRLSETKAKFKTTSDIEYWGFDLVDSEEPVKQGEIKTYTELNTPYSNKYHITYSTESDFKTCYTLNFELYAKYLVGAKIKDSIWAMDLPVGNSGQSNIATARIVKEMQKLIPDFWTKSLSIIGMPGRYY